MTAEFLSLLCLGLCLGYEDEKKNEKPPKPSLHAWPSSVVEAESNVTLKCQAHSQNVTFVLRKVNDSGYKQEQSSAENEAEFPFTDLKPKDAGRYFCAYKTTASHEWSESSEHLQLVVTGSLPEPLLSVNVDPGMTPGLRTLRCLTPYNGTECIVIALLKMGIPEPLQVRQVRKNQTDFMLWNVTSNDSGNYSCVYYLSNSSHLASFPSNKLEIWVTDKHDELEAPSMKTGSSSEESTKRTSHSKLPEQEAAEADLSNMERVSLSTADPQGVTYAELSTSALSEAASDTTQEPPGSHEYAALKV
ncbi:V-set and transmembrane domain-containing protein 1 isoform X4 [Homo sapiens]|uniref:V-set and transmembrane domain-containing protein 1 isoform X4 n=1 Tax=Homo sapiens TaxID=9606 RepID=UPI0005D01C66|nr:V-set and transmembrane domain-containing protein 1 isoform X4 [Homo sapiens]XP_054176654.1 V-set and transmembrane domain-containing protein 1 isoform X4 [Homo sapiens]XP_054185653.1 V-set and transmembrane domain-containing protein 1 isoform X4 [Homo sapiens]XP_054186136.1 V-set and transmembrane domain-containing protein 1 isoform X4 [Homo sapiens]XP_054186444.1 V-set and transmembrane domain-containing protein 1 isoform X4 [Homo sapiens]XP_054186697.1 V-set and transmembrane domain-cont|eukprot:XP_011525150.1 V-set and transmembrane domain-containing protein 1 isoform X4 [Homo sapiens]